MDEESSEAKFSLQTFVKLIICKYGIFLFVMHVLLFLLYTKECSYSWAMHSCIWRTGMAEDISIWNIEKGVEKSGKLFFEK